MFLVFCFIASLWNRNGDIIIFHLKWNIWNAETRERMFGARGTQVRAWCCVVMNVRIVHKLMSINLSISAYQRWLVEAGWLLGYYGYGRCYRTHDTARMPLNCTNAASSAQLPLYHFEKKNQVFRLDKRLCARPKPEQTTGYNEMQ